MKVQLTGHYNNLTDIHWAANGEPESNCLSLLIEDLDLNLDCPNTLSRPLKQVQGLDS